MISILRNACCTVTSRLAEEAARCCAGLAGIALDLPVTISESNAGLTPPAVAYALLGRGGAILIVIMVFMVSAQLLLSCKPHPLLQRHTSSIAFPCSYAQHRIMAAGMHCISGHVS